MIKKLLILQPHPGLNQWFKIRKNNWNAKIPRQSPTIRYRLRRKMKALEKSGNSEFSNTVSLQIVE